ncbi:uncharacterized protein LOC133908771 [Phragmites australis]|uniref:uncharacterized protein LOC133908771 n=1 Tax=Phragmites australis TaxID=29695 RepID=UPI002D769DAE|nr:uncharacterized protein LOC133908771 [Phragmites australis]
MRFGTRKRGGGGDHSVAAALGTVGLGNFAALALRDPPDGLEVAAAYDDASGCITVSVGGAAVSASPADLAGALALPRGPVGLATGADPALFSSAEAIAAVRGFVRDRVLLGGGEDGGAAFGEVAAALRLVEEGKAYEVDWVGLVWAVLKAGTLQPRRYAPYLLRLMEYQRPELFAEVDGRFPVGKRCKGQMLQQCQWTGENLVICGDHEVEEEEGEEETSLVYGVSQNIGDLEEMPIFGEGKEVTAAVPVDCKRAFVEGEGIHGLSQGNAESGSQNCLPSDAKLLGHDMECDDGERVARGNANNQSCADDSSLDRHLCIMDERYDSSSPQQLIYGIKSQPGSNLQRIIEIEDEDDDNDNVGVGPSFPVTSNVPLGIATYLAQQHRGMEGICNGQTFSPFNGCLQQIIGHVLRVDNGYLGMQTACRDTQAEVQRMKEMVAEKERIIAATNYDILQELGVRNAEMCRLELMIHTAQQYKELLKKLSAKFQKYRNMMLRGKGVDLYLDVLGIAGEQNPASVQQLHACHHHQEISRIQQTWDSESLKLFRKITEVETGIADLNHEVQRLKDSRSIPDLNSGMEDDGEGEASMSKTEDILWAGEGGRVSSTTEGGKQLGELTANPDQRNE